MKIFMFKLRDNPMWKCPNKENKFQFPAKHNFTSGLWIAHIYFGGCKFTLQLCQLYRIEIPKLVTLQHYSKQFIYSMGRLPVMVLRGVEFCGWRVVRGLAGVRAGAARHQVLWNIRRTLGQQLTLIMKYTYVSYVRKSRE